MCVVEKELEGKQKHSLSCLVQVNELKKFFNDTTQFIINWYVSGKPVTSEYLWSNSPTLSIWQGVTVEIWAVEQISSWEDHLG